MYTDTTIIDHIVDSFPAIVFDLDRSLYIPYCKAIESYVSKNNNIIIGDKNAISMMVNEPPNQDSFSWTLLTDKVAIHGKELLKHLYQAPTTNIFMREWNITLKLLISIPHKEVTIFINNRKFVTIINFSKLYKIQATALFTPSIQLPIIEEDIFLISLYQQLYTPYNDDTRHTYTQLLTTEQTVYNKLVTTNKIYTQLNKPAKTGSSQHHQSLPPAFIHAIITQFVTQKDAQNIIIGDIAIDTFDLNINRKQTYDRIQVITNSDPTTLNTILNTISKPYNITINIKQVRLDITDFRLTKHTAYATSSSTTTPFLDIFNSTTYEIIPYTPATISIANKLIHQVKIANPFVLMRFKFIDLWEVKMIYHYTKNTSMLNILKYIIINIKLTKKYISNLITANKYLTLFPLSNHTGTYIPEKIAKQILKKQYPYYPPIYASRLLPQQSTTLV